MGALVYFTIHVCSSWATFVVGQALSAEKTIQACRLADREKTTKYSLLFCLCSNQSRNKLAHVLVRKQAGGE